MIVLNAVNSALKQNFDSYQVILSDNSTNNETYDIFSKWEIENFKYIKREPSLSSNLHFNTILSEVTSDYFMIFHDDDVMYGNSLCTLYNKISNTNNCKIIAAGSNAYCIQNGKSYLYNKKLTHDIIINDKNELIRRYLLYDIVPFSSYLFCKEVASKLNFDFSQGGKYCDASFIVSILNLGPILYISTPLMNYYIHSGQDSSVNNFTQKLKLINYYINNSSFSRHHPLIIRFRLQNIFVEFNSSLTNKNFKLFTRRNIRIAMLLFKYSKFEYFPRFIYAIALVSKENF